MTLILILLALSVFAFASMQTLIQAGANVDAKTSSGVTPLHFGAEYAHLEIVEVRFY